MEFTKSAAITATALTMIAQPVLAGGMAEPVMEPDVVVEEAAGTSGGFLIPLLLLVLIAAAVSNNGSSVPTEG